MKTYYLHILMFGFALSGVARANFSGEWEGTGKAWDSNGWKSDCETIQLEAKQTSTHLQRPSGGYQCGTLSSTMNPLEVEIRGTELWFDGSKVGEITSDSLSVSGDSGPFKVTYKARLIDSKTMSYEERLSGEFGYLVVEGILHKSVFPKSPAI